MIVKAYGIEIRNVRGSLSDMKTQALASACAKQHGKKKRGAK